MTYQPVVDTFAVPVPLDPWSAALFAAAFVAAAALTARRAAYGLAALVLIQPFALYREVFSTDVTMPKVVLLGTLLGLSSYAGIWRTLRERPAPLLLAALGAYLVAMLLSFVHSAHHGATARETFKTFEYALLFVTAYLCYRLDPDDALLAGAVALAAIAVASTALAQEALGAPSGLYVGNAIVPRIAGALEGPNQLAGYFEVSVAALGALAVWRRTPLGSAALLLSACADVLTFSRAGLIGLGLVFAVLFLVARGAALRALRPAFAGLVLGAAGVGAWAIYAHSASVLRVSFGETEYAGGVGGRGELYRAAWRMFLRHPLFGVGAGNYELELGDYGLFGVRTHANSWYLQSLAEGGAVLFAATLALIGCIVGTFARALRASPWALAAFAAGLCLGLHQIADYLVFYPKVGGPWWLLAGIGAASIAARAALAAA
ncbi:MAG TPA: O-antigen ligase family protein [Verrucomicrobiae bacterium]|nr:O-antigen ligase family protein [Verrucomicrobiae bacterium]